MTITATPLTVALSYQAIQNHIEKKSNLKLQNRLALEEEKLVLKAVRHANRKDKPAANKVASNYQRMAGKTIEIEALLQKLNEAEETGLVRRKITG